MNRQKAKSNRIEISVIGSGIAGITTAFHLRKKGYKVNLIDPNINSEIKMKHISEVYLYKPNPSMMILS